MSDEVIEPSEIITGRDEDRRAQPSHVNPWVRFFARAFDYALLIGLLYWTKREILFLEVLKFIPLVFFLWIPIETLFLCGLGFTPGKWLLRTRLHRHHQRRLPFEIALRRSFAVWLRGVGLGISFISVLCMLNAYNRLKLLGTTSWDKEAQIFIEHLSLPRWRFYLIAAFAMVGFGLYVFGPTLGL